jgi:hypothetical protein
MAQSNCTLYVSAANKWSTFAPLPKAIAAFAMITLHDSQPYVFGGLNSSFTAFNTVYTFDTTDAWTPRTPMQQPLQSHTAVALDTNTAMVCGGLTTKNISSTQSQCSKYTICICGRHNFSNHIYELIFSMSGILEQDAKL